MQQQSRATPMATNTKVFSCTWAAICTIVLCCSGSGTLYIYASESSRASNQQQLCICLVYSSHIWTYIFALSLGPNSILFLCKWSPSSIKSAVKKQSCLLKTMNIHHHSSTASEAAAAAAAAVVSGHQHAGHHTGHHPPVNNGGTSTAAGGAVSSTPAATTGTELSFEDFTAMSPFLDPSTAALHLANPYAASASLASVASNAGKHKPISFG